jgi:hypothetical protein
MTSSLVFGHHPKQGYIKSEAHTCWNLHETMAGIKHETMCMIKLIPKMACTITSLLYPSLNRDGIHINATIDLMKQSHIFFYNIIITSLKQQRLRGLYRFRMEHVRRTIEGGFQIFLDKKIKLWLRGPTN